MLVLPVSTSGRGGGSTERSGGDLIGPSAAAGSVLNSMSSGASVRAARCRSDWLSVVAGRGLSVAVASG